MTDRLSFLKIDQVGFAYHGDAPILADVSLSLAPGDFHCLVGLSDADIGERFYHWHAREWPIASSWLCLSDTKPA